MEQIFCESLQHALFISTIYYKITNEKAEFSEYYFFPVAHVFMKLFISQKTIIFKMSNNRIFTGQVRYNTA